MEENLLTTWLSYRKEVFGQKRSDVIREINAKTGLKYRNVDIDKFIRCTRSTPDKLVNLLNQDLQNIIDWLIQDKNISSKEVAKFILVPIKL